MKQEEIAKQADEYSRQRVRENERYKALFTRSEIAQAFEDAAKWRINSVWHDMKAEEPQAFGEYADKVYPQVPCLVNGLLSTGYGMVSAIGTSPKSAGTMRSATILSVPKKLLRNGRILMTCCRRRKEAENEKDDVQQTVRTGASRN